MTIFNHLTQSLIKIAEFIYRENIPSMLNQSYRDVLAYVPKNKPIIQRNNV